MTCHTSPLRYKVERIMSSANCSERLSIEDWLVDLANARGARVVFRQINAITSELPDKNTFSDEELVVALCQLNCVDRPQMLRLAAQLISRDQLNLIVLLHLATIERAAPVLKGLADQALKVDSQHATWSAIHRALKQEKNLPEPLLHWTRLAEPQFIPRTTQQTGWTLVK